MKDWLGNDLNVGDLVLYSSSSSNVGMNLGEVTYAGADKIQIRIWQISKRANGRSVVRSDLGRIVTLLRHNGAYKTVTRYFGILPEKESSGS
jgi:hypothetical protein